MKIEKIIPGGFGLATAEDGKKMFFWNALPDEEILDYQITKNKTSYAEGIATKIKNPSPYRVIPKDECFLSTSPWQIMNYEYELKQKSLLVQEIFREHGITIEPPEVVTDGKDYGYRNKMEYALYYSHDDNRIHLAFHARGSHSKIPIKTSSLERPEIFAAATKIVDDLNTRYEEARKYQSLLLRCNQKGEVSGGLFENHKPHSVFKTLTDTILNQEYSYSPNGFFQINLPVYELALQEIKKYINTDEVLDLYAGVGTIGLSVARDHKLTLVEIDKSAYMELCKNVAIEDNTERGSASTSAGRPWRRADRTRVRNGNVLALMDKSENVINHINNNQTVIMDPPRAGADQRLLAKFLEVKPPKIIYLSCNPATQARDVKILLEKYHIENIKTFNFFPHTPHIENLIVLSL